MIGYQSLHSFSMGRITKDAPRGNVGVQGRCPVLKAENLGSVKAVKAFTWGFTPVEWFSQIAELLFSITGSDVDTFVNTLAVRLYSLDRDKVIEHLSHGTRMIYLRDRLAALHREYEPATRQHIIDWIAESLCLSNMGIFNPMTREVFLIGFLRAHSRSLQPADSSYR